MKLERGQISVKIKGDAGVYGVWGIDWKNLKVLVSRACGEEWVPMKKLSLEILPCASCGLFEQYESFSDMRIPDNCSKWLCNDGGCQFEKGVLAVAAC